MGPQDSVVFFEGGLRDKFLGACCITEDLRFTKGYRWFLRFFLKVSVVIMLRICCIYVPS